jgi:fructoselysine-6-phosphate deglycase
MQTGGAAMKDFDRSRYLSIQSGAVGLAPRLDGAIGEALAAGARNIFFLGAGGAAILMHPAAQLLQRSSSFPAFADISAEVLVAGHRQLGRESIVVIPSLSGTTRESVEMAEHCRALGAKVLALVGKGDTQVAKAANHAFVNAAADDTSCESFYLQSLLIALLILRQRGERTDCDAVAGELSLLPNLLADLKEEFDGEAEAWAKRLAPEPWHLLTAAGNCWPEAWYFGMCILEEMQWIRTRPVHASDFFHGPLELVEKGVSALLLKGEDDCRPLADRAGAFLAGHTDKLLVLDTKDFALPGLSPATRALVAPALLAAALERVSVHVAAIRQHPLTTRRYYRRIDY